MQKVLIVTGASHGIGAETARLAAARDYAVCVNYWRHPDRAEKLVEDIKSAGGNACCVQADIAVPDEVVALFDTVERDLGPVTGLVNNAAVAGSRNNLKDVEFADLQRIISVNLIGTMVCAREAVRRMSTAAGGQGGSIVNISSTAAVSGGDRLTPYVASKAGINAFTVGLAREVGEDGIRVNAVSPGIIETETLSAASEDWKERQIGLIPLGRLGRPEEVVALILWLLSDEASYVTGSVIPVSGGR